MDEFIKEIRKATTALLHALEAVAPDYTSMKKIERIRRKYEGVAN